MSLKITVLHLSPVSLLDLHACSENCIFFILSVVAATSCTVSAVAHRVLKGSQIFSMYHYVQLFRWLQVTSATLFLRAGLRIFF